MSGERIQLCKNLKEEKYKFPLIGSEKLDGCAAEFYWEGDKVVNLSRNQKVRYTSVRHIEEHLERHLPKGNRLIGELHIPNMHFKDASGFIRAEPVDTRIRLGIYDCTSDFMPHAAFTDRYERAVTYFPVWAAPVFTIEQRRMNTLRDIEIYEKTLREDNPSVFEGMVLRVPDEVFQAGKRQMIRRTQDPTVDLKVIGFTEAISKDGEPLERVGQLTCEYNGGTTGVGAGKMTHQESMHVWENQGDFIGMTAQVKHKRDTSYEKLRQPTFQLWRHDL